MTALLTALLLGRTLPGATVFDADIYSQVEFKHLNDQTREQYLADVRTAGIGTVLVSIVDYFEDGEARRRDMAKLSCDLRFFETNGMPALVWMNGLGYGDPRKGKAAIRLANSTRLTAFDGRTTGAICPTDPTIRQVMASNICDFARAGARFILMDDEFVQSVRPGLGCVCSSHLAAVSRQIGRSLTAADIRDSFTGKPNAVRTAYLDVSGHILTDLAHELRQALDAVDPTVGMGLCASFTHYDVEGTDIRELIAAFAGNAPTLYRISGAPYWRSSRYAGSGLEGTLEFVRMQSAWFRACGFPVLDENDPYPRRTKDVPAALCELYDKAVIADGGLRRHKYMLCYGPDRSETGYLDAHLANRADDVLLRRIFADTTSAGIRVLFRQHAIRDAELPTPYAGDWKLMGLFSHPLAAHFLVRNGVPCRHEGSGPFIAFGNAAREIGQQEIAQGVIVDQKAAQILAARGVDVSTDRFCRLDFKGCDLNFATSVTSRHRQQILSAYRRFTGHDLAVSIETASPRIYQLLAQNTKDGTYSILLENLGDKPADVFIRTVREPTVLLALKGEFNGIPGGLKLSGLPPLGYAAVKVRLTR